jgi:hypothetical protein
MCEEHSLRRRGESCALQRCAPRAPCARAGGQRQGRWQGCLLWLAPLPLFERAVGSADAAECGLRTLQSGTAGHCGVFFLSPAGRGGARGAAGAASAVRRVGTLRWRWQWRHWRSCRSRRCSSSLRAPRRRRRRSRATARAELAARMAVAEELGGAGAAALLALARERCGAEAGSAAEAAAAAAGAPEARERIEGVAAALERVREAEGAGGAPLPLDASRTAALTAAPAPPHTGVQGFARARRLRPVREPSTGGRRGLAGRRALTGRCGWGVARGAWARAVRAGCARVLAPSSRAESPQL